MPLTTTPDPTLQSNLMAFGWECGKGWHPIIKKLLADINALPDYSGQLMQVKEKFGELRVYLSNDTPETELLVDAAEALCARTCEVCGRRGKNRRFRRGQWDQTNCLYHYWVGVFWRSPLGWKIGQLRYKLYEMSKGEIMPLSTPTNTPTVRLVITNEFGDYSDITISLRSSTIEDVHMAIIDAMCGAGYDPELVSRYFDMQKA